MAAAINKLQRSPEKIPTNINNDREFADDGVQAFARWCTRLLTTSCVHVNSVIAALTCANYGYTSAASFATIYLIDRWQWPSPAGQEQQGIYGQAEWYESFPGGARTPQ